MNYKFSLHELISTAESHILFICKDTNDLEFNLIKFNANINAQ